MKTFKWAAVLLTLFLLFTAFVSTGFLIFPDQQITVFLQSRLPRAFDTPLSSLSLLGSAEVTILSLLILLVILKFKKSVLIVFFFAMGTGIELLGKIFLYHPGPPKIFFRYNLDILFPSGYVQTGHSFPSGHSFRTAFLALLISYLIFQSKKLSLSQKRLYSFLSFLFLFLMLFSRVTLGEHWTTDVIGGLLLGLSLCLFSLHFMQKQQGKRPIV